MYKEEIIASVKDGNGATGNLYDYISYNYPHLSKEELGRVAMEVIFLLDRICSDSETIRQELIESLQEYLY